MGPTLHFHLRELVRVLTPKGPPTVIAQANPEMEAALQSLAESGRVGLNNQLFLADAVRQLEARLAERGN